MKKGTNMPRENKTRGPSLRLQKFEETWGDRFNFIELSEDELHSHNLVKVDCDGTVDCIDERDNKDDSPRMSQKLAGASMAKLVLKAIEQKKSLDDVMQESIEADEVFYWHDDDHDHPEGMTGCGANDKEAEIVLRYLTKVNKMPENEARVLRDKVIAGKTARQRVEFMKELAGERGKEDELVVKVSSLTGDHNPQAKVAINMELGKTLIHGEGGERNFVVDAAGDTDQIHLALATVDILSSPRKIDVLYIK